MSEKKENQNPAITDLREMDVLRFLFELKREQIDPAKLQKMLLEHQIQNQVRALAQKSDDRENHRPRSPSPSMSSEYSSTPTSSRTNDEMPDPNIIFKYTSPVQSSSEQIFKNTSKAADSYKIQDRCRFINMNQPPTPASSSPDSDSDQENLYSNSQIPKLSVASKIVNWCGSSIYNNLPELVMTEYDKMLRDSHTMKVEVVEALNNEFPVSYEYNPKKSRIRTNYNDPQIADDRTRNNIASRRSRQRKKFHLHMIQYSVDFDTDENFLMEKQEKWLQGMIGNLEKRLLTEQGGISKIRKLRKQCGFD
jgi:hypothetical protein